MTSTEKQRIKFECKQCGTCCKIAGGQLPISNKDMKRWKRQKRQDILKWVSERLGYLRIDPETGKEVRYCPWLRKQDEKYICFINDTKPEACREYPFYIAQIKQMGCQGKYINY